jgi:hypothetical protein
MKGSLFDKCCVIRGHRKAARIALLVVLSPLFGTMAAGEQSTIQPVSQADTPVFRVGDTWAIGPTRGDPSSQHPPRQTVIEVTPEQTRIAVQTTSGNPYEIDLNSAGAVTVSGPTQYRPGRGYVHFPLSVGASWDENYTATATGRETSWVAHHVTVDGVEIVHVVAGDFFAFRLVARGEVDRVVKGAYHRGSTFTETYWYAPSVKRVIKHESTNYYYGASADDLNWELYNYSLVDPLKPAAASATAP